MLHLQQQYSDIKASDIFEIFFATAKLMQVVTFTMKVATFTFASDHLHVQPATCREALLISLSGIFRTNEQSQNSFTFDLLFFG